MQLHIDGIKECHSYDDLFDYFNKFGRIKLLKIIDTYGFITFDSYEDALKVTKEKHSLKGFTLYVDEARRDRVDPERRYDERYRPVREPFDRYDRYDRPPPPVYDRYERYDRPLPPPVYDRYAYERYDRDPVFDRRRTGCDYCDRCPEHGVIRERSMGHPKDKLKIVMMGIPENVDQNDVKEFVRSHNMDATYVRITNNKKYAIVEFDSIEEKSDALTKLDNKEFMGCNIQVRNFKSNGEERAPRKRFRENDNERREEKNFEEQHDDKVGVYEDIQERNDD